MAIEFIRSNGRNSPIRINTVLRKLCLIFSIILLAFRHIDGLFVAACDLDQAQHGCRIDNGACSCSYGCKSEYRYATLRECTDALKVVFDYFLCNFVEYPQYKWVHYVVHVKGRSNDLCSREPCQHRGVCIQITQAPGYRCRCEGTGYWGNRCQRKCPNTEESLMMGQYPYECIVIWWIICRTFQIIIHVCASVV